MVFLADLFIVSRRYSFNFVVVFVLLPNQQTIPSSILLPFNFPYKHITNHTVNGLCVDTIGFSYCQIVLLLKFPH